MMPVSNTAVKEGRLSVRIPIDVKNSLLRAATLRGLTLSDFIVSNMISVAETVIQEHQVIKVSDRDYARLMEAIDNPPKPNRALLAAAKDYRKAIANGEITVED
jgi:uncharacterized protein (DUF1778 family)